MTKATLKTTTKLPAVEHDAGGDAAMARAAKKLPVPKPTAKQQALSAAREETGKRVKKTGKPSSDAKTPAERAETVKRMLSENKPETKSALAPTSDLDIPEFLRRKPGEKIEAPVVAKTNGAASVPYVDPREQHQRELREAQKQADAEKAAAKRAAKKKPLPSVADSTKALKAINASTVDKTAMPLTGKAALRAINEAAIAKSDVAPTKVPAGMTAAKAKREAERNAKIKEQNAKTVAKVKEETAKIREEHVKDPAKAKRAAERAERSLKQDQARERRTVARSDAKAKKPKGVLREFRDEEAAKEAERANKVLRIMPRKPNEGERKLYDWKGAREAAANGKIPSPPDFSANTHRVYRPALAAVVELVNAKNLEGLQKHRVEGSCSSPKAIKRYREIAIIALKAKAAQ